MPAHPEGSPDDVPAPGIRDTRLEARAIKQRWPMSESVRIAVLKRLCGIVDPEGDPGGLGIPSYREVIAAATAILSADRTNLMHEVACIREELTRTKLDLEERRLAHQMGAGDKSADDVRTALLEAEARANSHVPDKPPAH